MCRNITELRGLEPSATDEEIEAAARQYVRKVSGIQRLSDSNREPFELAADVIAARQQHVVRVDVVGIGDARGHIVEVLLGEPVAVLEHPPPARPGEVALAAQQERLKAGAGRA